MARKHSWGIYAPRKLSLVSGACLTAALAAIAAWPMGSAGARGAPVSVGELATSTSSRMTHDWVIDAANHNIYFLGNRVGVGTATPTYKVDSRTTAYTVAVYGRQNSTAGVRTGVYGVAASAAGRGVVGVANASDGTTFGGLFDSHAVGGRGCEGQATATTGANYGVSGRVTSNWSTARGVIGFGTAPADAVRAVGDLVATGVKAFEIDHPIDPANKWLRHYATETPDPMNAYSGNVSLDRSGSAWVALPEWFELINRDFRYQLTSIGSPGPNLHVAREIKDNVFLIAGGTPGGTVSWRVEAVRNDLYVRTYGAPTEVVKPTEARNLYLHPELYQLPADRALDRGDPEPETVPAQATGGSETEGETTGW